MLLSYIELVSLEWGRRQGGAELINVHVQYSCTCIHVLEY